jgi:hypothetical protein
MIRGEVLYSPTLLALAALDPTPGGDARVWVDDRTCREAWITECGLMVEWLHTPVGVRTFYPWHRVLWLSGTRDELDPLDYIGVD